MKPYYQDSAVTIIHGDAREIVPYFVSDGDTLLLTDPQYQLANGKKATTQNAESGRGHGQISKGMAMRAKDWGKFKGDDAPFDPEFLLRFEMIVLWGGSTTPTDCRIRRRGSSGTNVTGWHRTTTPTVRWLGLILADLPASIGNSGKAFAGPATKTLPPPVQNSTRSKNRSR